ncbi:ROK family protein [Desulfosarcina ovata]|uniref:Fructokinase n=1 Tax=Desulfosarcina ovata subsp. ovata TaxID=2752305 RepID=A0A5K8A8S3_9BACT|nr:ROK family protein [Desulfosarcina ovata]BBO88866.1 fructokinase [Desulfosarcina ovata subsp. ovata]
MTTKSPYRLGIDLGGTKTEAILLDPQGLSLLRERQPTPRAPDNPAEYTKIRDAVLTLIRETRQKVPDGQPCTIGIGIPGTINARSGCVQNANTTGLIGHPFQQDLEDRLGHPIAMENDANCFTLAEARQGAGQGYEFVFGIILGTGCGGGISIGGRIHTGQHRIAGEWGHFSVDPAGLPCYCGNRGCVETKISGGGVARSFFAQTGRRLSLEQITDGYRRGDAQCTLAFEQFLDDFGRCLGGLISVLDPDAVVLGGGVSNIDELYTLGIERVRHYAFHDHIETPILKHRLGDSAGVIGAAWIGR